MCVVSHVYGEFGRSWDGGGGRYACGTMARGLVACREMPEHFQSVMCNADDARSHCRPGAQLWIRPSRN